MAVKNPKGVTFAAIKELRSLADACIMLTGSPVRHMLLFLNYYSFIIITAFIIIAFLGSPIDNTWIDLYALIHSPNTHTLS